KIYIDYPVSDSAEFKGLSFPQVLYNYIIKTSHNSVVAHPSEADIALIINGGSHKYNIPSVSDSLSLMDRVMRKFKPDYLDKKYGRLNKSFDSYVQEVEGWKKKNPKIKIVQRLDDRYRLLCKVYGLDKTVRRLNELSDATIFQTKYCKSIYDKGVQTIFGFEDAYETVNPHIIYNGVDTEIFTSIGDTFELKGKIKIAHVATTGMTRKGLGKFLEVAHLLKDNPEIQFYLVGRQELDPVYGKDIPLFKNVTKLPHTSDRFELAKWYRSFDMLLYPTIKDCSPNVVLEAMSCGLPVIAANSGGTPELILKEDVSGGIIMHEQNPVYSVKEISENVEMFKKNAVKLIEKYHTKEIMGTNYLGLFENL
ncbi:glycosyltransferase, partial [bacterium]